MPAKHARKKIFQDANTRAKIQAGTLIHRLHQIAMGEVQADSTQVTAAKSLLNKVLPDLQSIENFVDVEGEVGVRTVNVRGVEPRAES